MVALSAQGCDHRLRVCPHVGFESAARARNIKGLDKYNMLRSGDVMVSVPQIQEQIVDVGGPEQGIVREILEVLVVERIQEQIHDRYLEDVKKAFAEWGKCLIW